MKTFVSAIPLMDRHQAVCAYQLCDRHAGKLFGTVDDFQAVGEYLLSPGLKLVNRIGIEPFATDKPLLVELNQYLLLMGVPTNMDLPPQQLICILPSNIPEDDIILQRCNTLLEKGYSIGLSGFPMHTRQSPFLQMASYVTLDYTARDFRTQVKYMVPYLQTKRLVVTNVPTMEDLETVLYLSGALFGGKYYNQPLTKGQTISPLKINALQLLNQVSQEDFDLSALAVVMERDPSISIALLRFINSPAVGIRHRISSIRSAVSILGQREIRRWINVAVSVALCEGRPNEISRLSLIRAKFAENLANAYLLGIFAPSLFMAGLFSLLDVILERPMSEAVKEVPVDERVRMALVERSGPLYEVLDMVYAYETANWDRVSINMIRNNVDVESITEAFVDALLWYKDLLTEIDDEKEEIDSDESIPLERA